MIRGEIWVVIFTTGISMLLWGNSVVGLAGGVLMAITLPGLWLLTLADIELHGTEDECIAGRFMAVASSVYLLLIIGSNSPVTFAYKTVRAYFEWCGIIQFSYVGVVCLFGMVLVRWKKRRSLLKVADSTDGNYKSFTLKVLFFLLCVSGSLSFVVRQLLVREFQPDTNQLGVMTWNIHVTFYCDVKSL
jgi:uncharacterized membrane protein